jgi:hypothetical protein
MSKPLIYTADDVSRITGLRFSATEPVPRFRGEGLMVYYPGYTLPELRGSPIGKTRMWQDRTRYRWVIEPRYYYVKLCFPGSSYKLYGEQEMHLRTVDSKLRPAPVIVAATALLVHLVATGENLLKGDWCRCAETLPDGRRAELTVCEGRVDVKYYWDTLRLRNLWLAAARPASVRKP